VVVVVVVVKKILDADMRMPLRGSLYPFFIRMEHEIQGEKMNNE
jgi:hypothetical protein